MQGVWNSRVAVLAPFRCALTMADGTGTRRLPGTVLVAFGNLRPCGTRGCCMNNKDEAAQGAHFRSHDAKVSWY